jgi:LCP family protein required for cell wall assembly
LAEKQELDSLIIENRKTFIRHFVVAFLVLTLILVPVRVMFASVGNINLFGGSGNLMKEMPILVDENSPFFESFKDAKRVNVLLMGTNQSLSDTIILASYDMENQKVDLISIPRDTYFERDGYNSPAERKINAAYGAGKALSSATAVSEVLMGMPIHYYAVVDYKGVANIVDSMGGVPVNVPFHMVYNDPYAKPQLHINIEEGYQVLDGEKAVQFIRYRHGYTEGDIGRVKAQQEFMKAAFRQALSLKLPAVASTVFENVESDITLGMATKIATKAVGLTSESITTYLLPGHSQTINGASYWISDRDQIEQMLLTIYAPKAAADETSPAAAGTEQN